MRQSRRVVVVTVVLAVVLLASMAHASAVTVVKGYSESWRPRRVEIARGATVKWRSIVDDHNVTAYRGDWDFARTVREGDSIRRTFNRRGRYKYFCTWHATLDGGDCSGMCGIVTVG